MKVITATGGGGKGRDEAKSLKHGRGFRVPGQKKENVGKKKWRTISSEDLLS